jgi:hypothetical protein
MIENTSNKWGVLSFMRLFSHFGIIITELSIILHVISLEQLDYVGVLILIW